MQTGCRRATGGEVEEASEQAGASWLARQTDRTDRTGRRLAARYRVQSRAEQSRVHVGSTCSAKHNGRCGHQWAACLHQTTAGRQDARELGRQPAGQPAA